MKNIKNYLVDYEVLAKAQKFYNTRGFTPIETPWMVDKPYSLITTSNDKAYATKPRKHLVGSAEQSLLQLAFKNKLIERYRYQSITPCFRRDAEDASHCNWFMKLELFEFFRGEESAHPIENLTLEYQYFISSAWSFFCSQSSSNVEVVPTEDGSDLEINGVEVGSYGKRRYKNITWIYGTGIALPRFNYAIDVAVT